MRTGTKVVVGFLNEDGEAVPPSNAQTGTIIAIKTNCDCDGYERTDSVTVRWENGLVEDMELTGDEGGGWEIVDVTPELYVNLYLWDREYGGPEEGDWWYDTYEPISKGFGDWEESPPAFGHFETVAEAEKALAVLKAWCNRENQSRRSPSSMASDGNFCAFQEAWPGELTPVRRPRYC